MVRKAVQEGQTRPLKPTLLPQPEKEADRTLHKKMGASAAYAIEPLKRWLPIFSTRLLREVVSSSCNHQRRLVRGSPQLNIVSENTSGRIPECDVHGSVSEWRVMREQSGQSVRVPGKYYATKQNRDSGGIRPTHRALSTPPSYCLSSRIADSTDSCDGGSSSSRMTLQPRRSRRYATSK